jgi:hypothetical protein
MSWEDHVQMRNTYKILVRKPERKKPCRRPRHRWVDNIKMRLKNILCDGVDWFHFTKNKVPWEAFLNMVMNLHVL